MWAPNLKKSVFWDTLLDIYSSNSTLFLLHSQSLCNSYYTFWKIRDATWKMSIFYSILCQGSWYISCTYVQVPPLKHFRKFIHFGLHTAQSSLTAVKLHVNFSLKYGIAILNGTGIWGVKLWPGTKNIFQFLHCCILHLATHLKKLISISKQQSEF